MLTEVQIDAPRQGLTDITDRIQEAVSESGLAEGLCTLFVRHTSASLLIQEGADPSVVDDLESFFARLVPEGDPLYTHRIEGADDMPSHIRTALTATSLAVPVQGGELALGTWQRIFLWEHRRPPRRRTVLVHTAA